MPGRRPVVLVAMDAPPNYTDAERNAGFIATDTSAPRPRSLASRADFSRSGSGADAAFWMWRGNLYHGNALQVLRDVRQEMGAGDGPSAWTVGLLERIASRAREANVALPEINRAPIPSLPSTGNELGREWLALALWLTYGPSSAGGRGTIYDVTLPRTVRWPVVGESSWPAASGMIAVAVEFNPSDLSSNPFVTVVDTGDVIGPARSARSSSGALWVLGLLGAGVLLSRRS